MIEDFQININIKTINPLLVEQSFKLLQNYLEQEKNTQTILEVTPQLTSLLKTMKNNGFNLDFIDTKEFDIFTNKLKLLISYPQIKDFFFVLEGESNERNLSVLKEDLESLISDNQKSFLDVAHAYLEFHDVLKKSLENGQWVDIKNCWNKNYHFFDSDKISYGSFGSLFPHIKISGDSQSSYIKLIKTSQEKIAELLWNQFLLHPEEAEKLSKFVPDFFQFINWLPKSENTSRNFAELLEQKHWDNLKYASRVKGFDFFLEKVFLLNDKEATANFDPFSGASPEYNYINLDTIRTFNQKNINMDVVLKENSLGLPQHLRDYLYHHISVLEKSDKKYSKSEFAELDKLLIVYEKQKLESVFVVKNLKQKKTKI